MSLWNDLRLVVVDIETTRDHDERFRIVELATATCIDGDITGQWSTWVNPEVDVDAESFTYHGLSDELLQHHPTFDEVAGTFSQTLQPRGDEVVVIVAHHTRFDVPIIRSEYRRVGKKLTLLNTLDTMGMLTHTAGISPKGNSLTALCKALDIDRGTQHRAADDARACAQAVIMLLDRAEERGWHSLDGLLDHLGSNTTDSLTASTPPARRTDPAPMTAEHLATHTVTLREQPNDSETKAWTRGVRGCVQARCPLADARISATTANHQTVLDLAEPVLAQAAANLDTPGTATLLGALHPILEALPSPTNGTASRRHAALTWYDTWNSILAPLKRCPRDDPDNQCPRCLKGESCPLDTWTYALSASTLGGGRQQGTKRHRDNLFTTGVKIGTGTYTLWLSRGHRDLADGLIARTIADYQELGLIQHARQVAQTAWEAGGRGMYLAVAYVPDLARRGHLDSAIAACVEALAVDPESTAPAARQLRTLKSHYEGLQMRSLGSVTPAGDLLTTTRSRSRAQYEPRRTHPFRFKRPGI